MDSTVDSVDYAVGEDPITGPATSLPYRDRVAYSV